MLQANTSDHIHHILIYKCDDLTNSSAANTSDVCDDVHPEADRCRVNLLIGGWAVGAGVRIHTHTHIITCMYVAIYTYIFTCMLFIYTAVGQLMLLYACICVFCIMISLLLHVLFDIRNFHILKTWHTPLVETVVTSTY